MKKSQPIWMFIVIASLSAITAIAVERSIFGGSTDRLDQNILALEKQLAWSQAQRDSLNSLLAQHQDTLRALVSQEGSLLNNLDALRFQLAKQDSLIDHLRTDAPNHDITTDSLLHDLNNIVRDMHSHNGPGDNSD
ncbi:MAG: hypothetical protein AAF564_04565 [Bacteroidota bacterium]